MENEETQKEEVETSENNEELETETEEETQEVEDDNEEDNDTPTLEDFNEAKAKLKELEEKNKQLYARLKKTNLTKTETKETTSSDEEKLLKLAKLANQLDEEDLELLKTINGTNLEEKVNNPLFKSYKAQKDKKKRSEASALRPSTSGYSSGTGINKPDLTPEEHRKLWEKTMGR